MLIVELVTGLGVFLFGMMQLERSIESLGSNWIRDRLANSTRNPVGSVLSGTAITAVLQSSSTVGLIVLAFASAGIIPLYNAIGVLLGANLGTTFTGWVVTTLGFKLDLAAIALPAIGMGCLIQVVGDTRPKQRASGALIFGFGLLLFGLGLMKEAVAGLPDQLDLEQLRDFSAFHFLLLGTVLTAIIQSSSATMMITLTALHSGIIDLPGAAALIIGADLGTTSTTALGSIKGSHIKRQLALAHLLFNLVVDLLAFVLLLPLLPNLLLWFGITDPLYSLVAFHSTFNLLGLVLFIPFLQPYANWIGQRFLANKPAAALEDTPTVVPEAAIEACQHHVKILLASALSINLRNLRLDTRQLALTPAANELINSDMTGRQRFEQRYEVLKQCEGELLRYAARIQQQALDDTQAKRLIQLLDCARDTVYSVKTLKDIRPNLVELRHALSPPLRNLGQQYQNRIRPFYQELLELLASDHDTTYLREQLQHLDQLNEQIHEQLHNNIQHCYSDGAVEPEQLSTLLNINREIWHSGHNLLQGARHWYGI